MAHATISRLDQVFTLLENGGSSITRKAAAKQLGDVQKRYPHELNNLLAKLVSYIRNAEWGTRVAAVEAFEAVIEQVPKWNSEPNPNVDNQKGGDTESVDLECKTQLTFSDFDIDKLLDCSEVLLSSSGDEFKLTRAQQNGDGKMLAVNQRKFLEKSLGLNVAGNVGIGVSSNDLFKDEDLEDKELTEMKTEVDACNKKPCEVVMSEMLQLQHMSSRERNRAKRKAKLLMKQQSREGYSKGTNLNVQPAKKKKMAGDAVKTEAEAICFDAIPKHSNNPRDWVHWPMRWIYNELLDLLFNSVWESRHGACMALRILIKIHGNACGKTVDASTQQSSSQHQKCLIDLSIRLLSVITLDRFADFVSDQVVAPVRESCAQTLSIVTSYLDPAHVFSVIDVLLHLHTKEEWELRQSAMLAVQYIIAVRQDLLDSILPRCLPAITRGLQDKDGDVKSVAAKALLPATTLLVSHFATHVDELLALLWNSLREYDELTASTHSIMLLLSKLINALPPDRICGHKDAESLSSRLLPFFQHVEASVREAAVSTFSTLLSAVVPAQESVPWREETCVRVLSNIFESCAVERNPRVQQLSVETFLACVRGFACEPVLSCGRDYFRAWMMITCQHCHVSFDLSTLQHRHSVDRGAEGDEQKFIGGCFPSSHPPSNADCHVMKTRQQLAGMLGAVCWHSSRFAGDHVTNMQQLLLAFLASQSAMQQMVAAMVVRGFWKEAGERCGDEKNALSLQIRAALEKTLEQGVYFAEIAPQFMQLQTDMRALLTSARQLGVVVAADFAAKPVFSVLEIIEFCTELTSTTATDFKPAAESRLQVQRELVRRAAQRVHGAQRTWSDHVKSHAAGAVVLAASLARDDVTVTSSAWQLPPKLNSIIRPLMDTLKRERNEAVVERAVDSIAMLVGMCSDRSPSPTHKLVRNLISSLAALPARCPTHLHTLFSESVLSSCQVNAETVATDGIVTLLRQRSNSASEGWRRGKCDSTREDQSSADLTSLDVETASRNAESCIRRVCQTHTSHLFQVAPKLRELIYGIKPRDESGVGSEDAACISDDVTSLCHGLLTLEIVSSALESHPPVNQMLSGLLPFVVRNLSHQLSSVRFVAAHCLASLATHSPTTVMPVIIHEVLGEIESEDLTQRRGSIEALANVVEALGPDVVAYSVLLVVPLLGRMSDHEAQIRLLATSTFAQLIQYIPIESSVPDPPDMSVELTEKKDRDRRFLDQLFDSSSLEAYHVPITIRTTLRSYQEDGVKWLAFLNRYKLHGILCDDMGLGKTLQTICIVASDHFYKRQQIEEKAEASAQQQKHHLVSLVICPPTLTGHWVEEVSQFCDHLTPLHYVGTPPERTRLQANLRSHNLVIASYEVVRNDIHFFSAIKWNYCVLDEGHVIRNGKSKLSQCVKSLLANHRLILTGTPIQNNVLELWSLFDFLLPGFLGTEQEFSVRFTKPILASRDAKSTSREQEEGVLAMQALHRQVLPFMLRRMKEDVLKDLPPKIIQDYYCDLSQLQLELYDDFAKSKAKKVAESTIKSTCGDDDDADRATSKGTSHVFQALQYLQKVCNHPAFVLTPGHPHYTRITDKLCAAKQSIHDVKHASKLVALQQLLLDCGIGTGASQHGELQAVVSHHRALIFCQHRTMLDVIQNHLLHQHMPSVTYLRLDGQVPTNLRFSTVSRFNNDPSIDVLLLTTKVGGLGLNLTGADTVIFVEHDWNPMIDLQAMDRAHRIGQKKVVNVYRLITRGTLEEKILGLQKFKLKMARTIVSEDNRALHSMDTGQVLDLFNVNSTPRKWDGKGDNQQQQQLADSLSSPSRGLKAMMDGLSDLWDQNQYDEQYNLDTFLKSLS